MPTEDDRSSAMAFWSQATSYFRAATYLDQAYAEQKLELPYNDPLYFLTGHSIELALKAHLRCCGKSITEIKYHNLADLLKQAKLHQLPVQISELEEQHLTLLNSLHGSAPYQTRYPLVGRRLEPDAKIILGLVSRILSVIRDGCLRLTSIKS